MQLPPGSTLTLRYTSPRLSRPDRVTVTGPSACPGPGPDQGAHPTGCEARVGQAEPQWQVVVSSVLDRSCRGLGRVPARPRDRALGVRPGRAGCVRGLRGVATALSGSQPVRRRPHRGGPGHQPDPVVGGRRTAGRCVRTGDGAAVGRAGGRLVEGFGVGGVDVGGVVGLVGGGEVDPTTENRLVTVSELTSHMTWRARSSCGPRARSAASRSDQRPSSPTSAISCSSSSSTRTLAPTRRRIPPMTGLRWRVVVLSTGASIRTDWGVMVIPSGSGAAITGSPSTSTEARMLTGPIANGAGVTCQLPSAPACAIRVCSRTVTVASEVGRAPDPTMRGRWGLVRVSSAGDSNRSSTAGTTLARPAPREGVPRSREPSAGSAPAVPSQRHGPAGHERTGARSRVGPIRVGGSGSIERARWPALSPRDRPAQRSCERA